MLATDVYNELKFMRDKRAERPFKNNRGEANCGTEILHASFEMNYPNRMDCYFDAGVSLIHRQAPISKLYQEVSWP